MIHKIDAVLFDLDGTLLDTAPDLTHAINLMLTKYGKQLVDYQSFRQYISQGSPAMLGKSFGVNENDDSYSELRQELFSCYRNNINTKTCYFPGIEELLNHLNESNITWGIVTNKPTDLTEQLLSHYTLMQQSQCIICGDTLSVKKPDPAPLLHACELLNINPNNTVYVGDSENDIIAANAANMTSIAVSYGYFPADTQPHQWQADITVNTANDIKKWIDQQTRN